MAEPLNSRKNQRNDAGIMDHACPFLFANVAANNFLLDYDFSVAAGAMRGGVYTLAIGTSEPGGVLGPPVLDLVMSPSPNGPVFEMSEPWEFSIAASDQYVILGNSLTTVTFITEFAAGGELKDVPGVRLMAGKSAADISGDVMDFPRTGYYTHWTHPGIQQFDAVIDVAAVPEPGTIAMLLTGLMGSTLLIRRRRKAA